MTPDEFKRHWDALGASTTEEARETLRAARTDPTMARMLITVLSQAVQIDQSYMPLYRVVIDALMVFAAQRLAEDDDLALKVGALLADTMETTNPPIRTPRGKPRTAPSA